MALALPVTLLAGCGEPPAPSSMTRRQRRGHAPKDRQLDNTFWIAATVGLGAINTEAQARRVVQNHAEAGVDLILWYTDETYFASTFLEECAKYGIYTILMDNSTISGASENWKPLRKRRLPKRSSRLWTIRRCWVSSTGTSRFTRTITTP